MAFQTNVVTDATCFTDGGSVVYVVERIYKSGKVKIVPSVMITEKPGWEPLVNRVVAEDGYKPHIITWHEFNDVERQLYVSTCHGQWRSGKTVFYMK